MTMHGAGPTISTHVLDTAAGRPAAGIRVRLERMLADGAAVEAGSGTTDVDGRIARLLEGTLTAGLYRLVFHLPEDTSRFFHIVTLEFRVTEVERSYHVPLLLAPYAISSYRGS